MSVKAIEGASVEKKIVTISSKRQITIPVKFFSELGFDNKAECTVRGNALIIRPAKEASGGEFAEQILEDLIKQGLSGEELLSQFKQKQAQIRLAVDKMISEAEAAAAGTGEYLSYDEVFGTEEDI